VADLDLDGILAQLLDRRLQEDVPAIDHVSDVGETSFDVHVGDGAEETAALTGLRPHDEREAVQLGRHALGRLALAIGLRRDDALLMLELPQGLTVGGHRQAAREEVVACVSGSYTHYVTDSPQGGYVVSQDDLSYRHASVLRPQG
jgi:hypothetical protein